MSKVILTGFLICRSLEEGDRVSAMLADHIRLTRAEPGCLSFEVMPTADPMIWQVEESFTDRAAFDAHQTRTRATDWWAATAAIRRDFRIWHEE